jgi:site-specific DNA-methyltransferase (adenine-specific)
LAEGVTLYLGDCREILPTLPKVDAVVTDPPYGISFAHGGNDNSGIGGGRYATKFAKVGIVGDDAPFDPSPLLALSDSVILWGGNHYADKLPASSSWLIWDKRAASQHSNDFADCEIAWSSRNSVARIFRHHWDGMMRASERGVPREHPTQKPVAVMRWCIEQIEPAPRLILDPYMGSGSTGVAAVQAGRSFVGIEIEPGYFDIACRRVSESLNAPSLLVERPPPAVQESFLYDAADDFAKSLEVGYAAIRERKANGGPGWGEGVTSQTPAANTEGD